MAPAAAPRDPSPEHGLVSGSAGFLGLSANRIAPCRWRWMIFHEIPIGCCSICSRWLKSSRRALRITALEIERDTVLAERDAALASEQRRGASRDREAAALDPAAAARAVRPALGEARPRPAAARPGGPRADRGRGRGGAGGGGREEQHPSAAPGPATQPGRPAGAPAAGRGPGRRRGQELPLLRRGPARRSARTRARCSTSSPPSCG